MECHCEAIYWLWFDGPTPRIYIEKKFKFCPFCGGELNIKPLNL